MNVAAAEFILSELYPIFSNRAQRTNSIFLQKMVAKMVTFMGNSETHIQINFESIFFMDL